MKEDTENTGAYEGGGLKGPLYWLAGVTSAMALKSVAGPGGLLGGLFGQNPPPGGPGAPVSREVADLMVENATLRANAHADKMNADQMVVNAIQQGRIDCQQRQIDELRSMTRLTIPNGNLNPGYGPAVVGPAPAPVPPAAPDAAAIAAAVAAALAAQQKEAA